MNTEEMVRDFITAKGNKVSDYNVAMIVECVDDIADGKPVTTISKDELNFVTESFRIWS
jgi:hypothetical protein